MSDQNERPTYGLPGPTPAPAPQPPYGHQAPYGQPPSYGPSGDQAYGQQPYGSPSQPPQPAGPWGAPPVQAGYQPGYAAGPPPKRKGLKRTIVGGIMVVLGGILMIVLPIVLTGAMGMGLLNLTPLDQNGGSVEISSGEAIVVATADGDAGTCTVTGDSSDVTVERSSQTGVTEIDGVSYDMEYMAISTGDGSATVECSGNEHPPAVSEPVNAIGLTLGLFGSVIAGALVGLVGLILLIIGIVQLVRTRRR